MNFQFKQFSIQQDRCAFKVGTDSVLLGSWANPEKAKNILDVGTGSGVLALMMAQKSSALITAIDLEVDACLQSKENAENSPWKERIHIQHSSLQDFAKERIAEFDLIISNPPYFVNKAHATGTALSNARNTDKLPFQDLAKTAFKLLQTHGSFYVVLLTAEAKIFKAVAEKEGFVLAKLLRVQTKAGEQHEKRHLMLFQKTAFLYSEEVLVIEEQKHLQYTDSYKKLTQDFYLAF